MTEQGQLSNNFVHRSLMAVRAGVMNTGFMAENEAWLYRDDIGAPHGIKGYEEQINTVGGHHGHLHWPSEGTF